MRRRHSGVDDSLRWVGDASDRERERCGVVQREAHRHVDRADERDGQRGERIGRQRHPNDDRDDRGDDGCRDDDHDDHDDDDDEARGHGCRRARNPLGWHRERQAEHDGSGELRRWHLLGRSQEEVKGVGLGLRWEFLDELLACSGDGIDFLEISPENYMGRGGYYPAALARLSDRFPILTHGLTMSLGGRDALDARYLSELGAFVKDVRSPWHSDHLCFSTAGGAVLHDLLPVRFTKESAAHVAERVMRARDVIQVPLAVENITFYTPAEAWSDETVMPEPEWISEVIERADCGLMLDVNNAYVNAQNFGFDVDDWIRGVPLDRVVQIHVAGHEKFEESDFVEGATGTILLDTHGADVPDPVLALLERVLPHTGPVPIVLERDQSIPPFAELLGELARIRALVEALRRA